MQLSDFVAFVEQRAQLFRGGPKATASELADAEAQLKQRLPRALHWLLQTQGYSDVCGIENLEGAVEITVNCRRTIGLPAHVVVLNDWGDAGVVYLDYSRKNEQGEPNVIWTGAHNFGRLAEGTPLDEDTEVFAGYAEWVLSQVDAMAQ